MNDRELIDYLTQQNREQSLLITTLVESVNSLTSEVSELKRALTEKDTHTQNMVTKLNGLSKIALSKKSENRKEEPLS